VLVFPGTYLENIDFSGKSITVASTYILNEEDSLITQTVIDGSRNGSVVTFKSGENKTPVLTGFTITNGYTPSYGGGIYCDSTNAILTKLHIYNNHSVHDGGGIACSASSPVITKSVIAGDSTDWNGGGIACFNNSNTTLINVTIANNFCNMDGRGIAVLFNSNVVLKNSIIWNNGCQEIYTSATGDIIATYSDIENGTGENYFGSGCIDDNPLFVDADADTVAINYVYNLQTTSPCIDAGDPDPLYNDIDGTVADMGAYSYLQSGIRGKVILGTDCNESVHLEDVEIILKDMATNTDIDSVFCNPETGSFSFAVEPGSYNVKPKYIINDMYSFNPFEQSAFVVEGSLTTLDDDFVINPLPRGLIMGKVVLTGVGNETDVLITASSSSTHPYPVYDGGGSLLYYEYALYVESGTWDVEATLEYYQSQTIEDVPVFPAAITSDIDFVLDPAVYPGYIQGKITLKNGPGNVQDVIITDIDCIHTTQPDSTGNYLLETYAGLQDITAKLEHYAPVTIKDVPVNAYQTTNDIDITLLNWEEIPGTQYVMTAYTTITLSGEFVEGEQSNQVAVFGTGGINDCRGIAKWVKGNHPFWCPDYHYYDLPGYWYVTMTSDIQDGELLKFKVYDTETDSIYDCYGDYPFHNCQQVWADINAICPTGIQQFNLIRDWNWISFYLEPEDTSIASVFDSLTIVPDIYQVKYQNVRTTYDPNSYTWLGDPTFTNITKGEGYKVNMINPVSSFRAYGELLNPITNPIDLNYDSGLYYNYTWINYYPKDPLPIETALESIEDKAILVKTQSSSATIIEGSGWVGDLTIMKPGESYIVNVKSDCALTYPNRDYYSIPPINMKEDDIVNNAGWKLLAGTSSNMIAMASITANNKIVDADNYTIGVFDDNNDCRSIGKREKGFWYFTIVGNENGDELHFKIYDSNNKTSYENEQTITYKSDTILGNPKEPIAVEFNVDTENMINPLSLSKNYPNPFNPTTTFSYSITASGNVRLSVYNIKGQLVETIVDEYKEANDYTVNW
ncbi:MAG: hypothetical protein DRJ01_16365, partial [Bacteroidetes bacterium]